MPRDDFSQSVKNLLAARVGYLCSNPDCRSLTSGPASSEETGKVNIGVAAHITAAAPGGPRYDASLTSTQRSGASNGIWLCQNCSSRIDKDVDTYPTTVLYRWKYEAEQYAFDHLGVPNRAKAISSDDDIDVLVEHIDTPPFGLAFADENVPEYCFGLHRSGIPRSWNSVWVDVVRVRVTIGNLSCDSTVVIDGLSIDYRDVTFACRSAIQYAAQGVSRSIEFLVPLGDASSTHADLIRRQLDTIFVEEKDFFANGGTVKIAPGDTETILFAFVARRGAYEFKPALQAVVHGVRRNIAFPGESSLKVISSSDIPYLGKQWTIYLDGHASGEGFLQNNLERYADCLS